MGPTRSYSNLLLENLQLEQKKGDISLFSLSPLTTPESTPPGSPRLGPSTSQISPSPPEPDNLEPLVPGTTQLPPRTGSTHAKRQGHSNRAKKRRAEREQKKQEASTRIQSYKVRTNVRDKHVSDKGHTKTPFSAEDITISSSGYVGVPGQNSGALYTKEQLVGPDSRFKFQYVPWTSEHSLPIADAERRVLGLCAGTDPKEFEGVNESACEALEAARLELQLGKDDRYHRRGKFPARATGISHGGGQTKPKVRRQRSAEAETMNGLRTHPAFVRLAGHASAIFATWAPRMHAYYASTLQQLLDHDESLSRNFANSVFAASTWNFGPSTVCFPHKDPANLPFGWCAITALGNYDPILGGHLVLWELELVIEFPPGSTIMVPSSTITHSNTRIQPGEKRFSFTQYSAGGLFRWVESGFQKVDDFRANLSEEEQHIEQQKISARLEKGLSLLSTLDEL